MRKLGNQTKNVRSCLYISPLVNQKSEPGKKSFFDLFTSESSESSSSKEPGFFGSLFGNMEKDVARPRTEEELLQEVKNAQTSKEEAVRILKDLEDKLAANAYPALARPLVRSTAAQLKETIQKMELNINTLKQELSAVQKAAKEASKTAETVSKETVETVETVEASASEAVETAAKGVEENASKAASKAANEAGKEAANEAGKEAGKESVENTAKKTVDSLKDSVLNRFGKGSGKGGSDGNSPQWNQKLVLFR